MCNGIGQCQNPAAAYSSVGAAAKAANQTAAPQQSSSAAATDINSTRKDKEHKDNPELYSVSTAASTAATLVAQPNDDRHRNQSSNQNSSAITTNKQALKDSTKCHVPLAFRPMPN